MPLLPDFDFLLWFFQACVEGFLTEEVAFCERAVEEEDLDDFGVFV
jgi:hypothetical protein